MTTYHIQLRPECNNPWPDREWRDSVALTSFTDADTAIAACKDAQEEAPGWEYRIVCRSNEHVIYPE